MVYFIQMGTDGPIKIGFTTGDISKRLEALQIGNPYPLVLLLTIEGDARLEKAIHAMFSDIRMVGEWFENMPRLVAYINILRHEKEFPTVSNDA